MGNRILVIGDTCKDVYWYGDVDRISPEAPVPVFNYMYSQVKPGMALNVVENLKALGLEVDMRPEVPMHPITKTRMIDIKSGQQMMRVDHELLRSKPEIPDVELDYSEYSAIVIVDYCKGIISSSTIDNIRTISEKFSIPVFVDSKSKNLAKYSGFIVKVNEQEKSRAETLPENSDLIVTLGNNGATWVGNIYRTKKVPVHDVTGAGDTFLSALVYKYLLDKDIRTSIKFANSAAGITVQKVGTYAPTLSEIEDTIPKKITTH